MAKSETLPPLSLPKTQMRLRRDKNTDYVYCPIRAKWLVLTPEEWVRQHFMAYLQTPPLNYPKSLIASEVSIRLMQLSRRCDTVVYNSSGKPVMIIEYKAPHVAITSETFNQIARYNLQLRVPWLIVSNGLRHYCCHTSGETQSYTYIDHIPTYAELIENI